MSWREDREIRFARGMLNLLVVLSAIVTIGILPVALNSAGVADRLSFVPGISNDGGFVSALSYTVLLVAIAGAVIAGAYLTVNGLSVVDSGSSAGGAAGTPISTSTTTMVVTRQPEAPTQTTQRASTATQTATPTPTHTPTRTPTPTSTATPTPNDEDDTSLNYIDFAVGMQIEMERLTDKPIYMKGMYADHSNATLWVIMNGTNTADNWTRAKAERSVIVHAYRRALVIHKRNDEPGDRPLRMRFVDWNETSQTTNSDTFFVHSYDAWAYQNETISANEFFQRWFRSSHAAPDWVEEQSKEVARDTENITFTPLNESTSNESLMQVPRPTLGDSEPKTGGNGRKPPYASSRLAPRPSPAPSVDWPQRGHVPA